MRETVACPACSAENPPEAKFCMACATPLGAAPGITEERKVVTTLFCDLVAFTAMSEVADPEDVDRIVGEYFARVTKVIESHGGTVEKFIGDAVVGVFGVPVVHEDDPERAVRAGLRLIEAVEGMTRPDGSSLQVRIGINTGEALVRLDIDPASGRGFLTGNAVNVAARLQAAAPPSGVAVGALTHELTAGAIQFEELPASPPRARPSRWPRGWPRRRSRVWESTSIVRSSRRSSTARPSFSFLSRCSTRAAQRRHRRSSSLSVNPESGRVASCGALRRRRLSSRDDHVATRPLPRLSVRGRLPALAEIVKGHAGVLETDDPNARGQARSGPARQRGPRLVPPAPARLLGLEAPHASREENFTAWLRFLEERGRRSADRARLRGPALGRRGAARLPRVPRHHLADVPLLVIATARPGLLRATCRSPPRRASTASCSNRCRRQRPRRWSAACSATRRPRAVRPCRQRRRQPLLRRAVRTSLRDRADYRAAGQVTPLAATVQAVIAARLDALAARTKGVLADASVVGERLLGRGVVALGRTDSRQVDEALWPARRRQLIRRSRDVVDGR